jgi:hypothetical protein
MMQAIFNGVSFFIILTTVPTSGQSIEVQVDETGTIEDARPIDFGYKFGPTTSRASVSPKPWSILDEIFPDATESLSNFWGKHPVHLPRSDAPTSDSTFAQIVPSSNKLSNRFSNLFKADDSLTVLRNNPNLVHGKDYYILKYLLRDGEEWNGQLPYKTIPVNEIPSLLNRKAFSLVINYLDYYWNPVKDFARSLELETSAHVSCNLYLTPPKLARAFESHMDWMDVLVLQLEGEKKWSVARDPMIKLLPPDRKRKPTTEELKSAPFENVLLRPGDALYIPRGHLHNATTTMNGGHSLHLTFGIQYGPAATYEALVHHTLELYKEDHNNEYIRNAAVSPHSCEHGHTLTWVKLLHYSISELARQTDCGGFGESGGKKSNENDAICSLRESIPIHPQFQRLNQQSDDAVNKKYQKAVEAIFHQVNAVDALNFMNALTLQNDQGNRELGSATFQYIGIEKHEPFSCKPISQSLEISQDTLVSLAEDFYTYAKDRFHDARQRLIDHTESDRISRWQNVEEGIRNL